MRVLALVAVLALAGCLGAEDAVESAAVEPAAVDGTAAAPSASPSPDAAAAVAAGTNGTAEPVEVPVDLAGKTGIGYCLPSGPNSCSGRGLPVGDENTHFELALPGLPRSGTVVLEWTAASPATTELHIMFAA